MSQTALMPTRETTSFGTARAANFTHRVGQWELVEFAGLGSLAHVYRARPWRADPNSPANYAIKMLRPDWADDLQAIRLLQREALVGQSVSHPHLISILSARIGMAPEFVVMPWLEGASLGARLAEGRQFDVPEALWIVRQAAEALDALDRAGWMHGDITPGNIHLSPSGHVTLLDLNFARRRDELGAAADRPIMGTCGYMAPEYLVGSLRPDVRSDIFSLGAVLFELLTGRRAFRAESLSRLAIELQRSEPMDLARLAPHAPPEAILLARRMMARDPLRRPQSPGELVERLVALEIATFTQRAE